MTLTTLELMNLLRPYEKHPQPKIVCLCGSTKFKDTFEKVNALETIKGNIVLSVGFFIHQENTSEATKAALDQLHFRKIDLADEIFVLNVDGYIGESTANEITYAFIQGKPVRFLEDKLNFKDPNHYAARLYAN